MEALQVVGGIELHGMAKVPETQDGTTESGESKKEDISPSHKRGRSESDFPSTLVVEGSPTPTVTQPAMAMYAPYSPYGFLPTSVSTSAVSGIPMNVSFAQNIAPEQEQYLQAQYLAAIRQMQANSQAISEPTTPTKKVRTHSPTSPLLSPSFPVPTYTGRFLLLEQPNVRQRKSYKNENRYILPNPLTVCAREDTSGEKLPRILGGEIRVALVNADGSDLASSKQNIMESPEGGLIQQLDSNLSAHFSLKILETSEGTMFRLLFTLNYTLEAVGQVEEKILSRPFQVYSNKKKNIRERPFVFDMKPVQGLAAAETEVWIKGRGFNDKVTVIFGDKPAKLVEVTENLLTVTAPSRFDLGSDTTVPVIIANKYPHETMNAEKTLSFLYIGPNL